jgi:hypothetical protein
VCFVRSFDLAQDRSSWLIFFLRALRAFALKENDGYRRGASTHPTSLRQSAERVGNGSVVSGFESRVSSLNPEPETRNELEQRIDDDLDGVLAARCQLKS